MTLQNSLKSETILYYGSLFVLGLVISQYWFCKPISIWMLVAGFSILFIQYKYNYSRYLKKLLKIDLKQFVPFYMIYMTNAAAFLLKPLVASLLGEEQTMWASLGDVFCSMIWFHIFVRDVEASVQKKVRKI